MSFHWLFANRPAELGLLPRLWRSSVSLKDSPFRRGEGALRWRRLHLARGHEVGPLGLQICYDLRFPEVARVLALQGAEILVTVAQFPAQRQEQWRILARARAIENQIPHLACNWACGGGSLIIDARGQTMAEAGSEETMILADIDLADRYVFRREVPCFVDRRPAIYGRWEVERSNP